MPLSFFGNQNSTFGLGAFLEMNKYTNGNYCLTSLHLQLHVMHQCTEFIKKNNLQKDLC